MEVFNYTVKIHPGVEGGYWAEVPAFPGCFSQGETLQEVISEAHSAVELLLHSLMQRGMPIPKEKKQRRALAVPLFVQLPITR